MNDVEREGACSGLQEGKEEGERKEREERENEREREDCGVHEKNSRNGLVILWWWE